MLESIKEEWRDIENWDGFYSVSTFGRVRSNDRLVNGKWGNKAKKKGKILKPAISTIHRGWQYANVLLIRNRKSFRAFIHILVARAFIPNTENKPTVNHIDGNKLNNIVGNLEWATMKEQQQHALKTGLRKAIGEKSNFSKLRESDVRTIRLLFDKNEKTIEDLAKQFHTAKSNVQYIVNRQTWKHLW